MKDRLALCLPESVQPQGPPPPSVTFPPFCLPHSHLQPLGRAQASAGEIPGRPVSLSPLATQTYVGVPCEPCCLPVFVVEAGGWAPLDPFSLDLSSKSTGLSAAVPDHCRACPLSQTVEKMEKIPLPLNEATSTRVGKAG